MFCGPMGDWAASPVLIRHPPDEEKNDLDRWRRCGRGMTDERISDNRPDDGRQAARCCPGGGGGTGFKSRRNPRQNDLTISDGFLTNRRFTSQYHASPTESRDARKPAESTICARSAIGKPDGRGGGIRTHGLFVPNEARYQAALRPDILTVPVCFGRENPSLIFSARASGFFSFRFISVRMED